MCLFCKNEAEISRNYECYPCYMCRQCGRYIIPDSKIGKIRQKNLQLELKNFRNENEEDTPLFFGTKEDYLKYDSVVFKNHNTHTQSKFIDIETL